MATGTSMNARAADSAMPESSTRAGIDVSNDARAYVSTFCSAAWIQGRGSTWDSPDDLIMNCVGISEGRDVC